MMTDDDVLELYAPVSGRVVPVESVPDQVFSQKTIGDGAAFAPTSFILRAPCSGVVTNIHAAHHALTLKTASGVEVLLHIGLDTVMLKGAGFDVRTAVGQSVNRGDPLIAFDPETIESGGKSLLTEMVVVGRTAGVELLLSGRDVAAGADVVLRVAAAAEETAGNAAGDRVESWGMTIKNPAGLHARPIAVLTNAAKRFSASILLWKGDRSANAKSLVAVMGLDVQKGDVVRLTAEGTDARDAVKSLIPLIESGLGEDVVRSAVEQDAAVSESPAARRDDDGSVYSGVPVSSGVAVGVAVRLRDAAIEIEEFGATPAQEREKMTRALAEADEQLSDLFDRTRRAAGEDKAAIFKAHRELLNDPELAAETAELIAKGRSAAFAWRTAVERQAGILAEMQNGLLAGRAQDLRDVGRRVLRLITGEVEQKLCLPDNAVLIARELSPSDTASLDREKVAGFATVGGGAASHAAILARSLMLPAVAGLPEKVLDILNGTSVLLDGTKGELRVNPDALLCKKAVLRERTDREIRAVLFKEKDKPAVTADGARIEVCGNISAVKEAAQVVENGGDGVGLLRSEFLFSGRGRAPDEDEQAAAYSTVAETLGAERTLIVRTLDAGGDKPLSYLPMPREDNPFLGVRGIRLSLIETEVFRAQIRAILRAAGKTGLRLMFPMVADVSELMRAKQIVAEERERLNVSAPVGVGMMVEVPAAAVMADVFARYVDFFSIGTNDLTQYTMAADRGNARLADFTDALHPAVLRLIKQTADAAKKHGRRVGVCGAAAGESAAVPVLIGLGADELSVAPSAVPAVKAAVRALSIDRCRRLAQEVLELETAAAVRSKIGEFLKK